jgi:hypothetical protein
MNPFKFKYKVGNLFTDQECNDILRDLSLQDDRFGISPPIRTGDADEKLSVYEIDYNDLDNCGGKDTIDRRIKELENRLGLTYNGDRFIIKYKDDRKEMIPHYDGHSDTTLIYLTTDFEGGSTNFPIAGLEHKPQDYKPGHYIHYNSRHPHSFHGGTTVSKGTKIVIVLRSYKNNILTYLLQIPWALIRVLYVMVFYKDMMKNPNAGDITNN